MGTSSDSGDNALTKSLAALTGGIGRLSARGYWFARARGKADGPSLVACAVCGDIQPRVRAVQVTASDWACGDPHASQIAEEQAL